MIKIRRPRLFVKFLIPNQLDYEMGKVTDYNVHKNYNVRLSMK